MTTTAPTPSSVSTYAPWWERVASMLQTRTDRTWWRGIALCAAAGLAIRLIYVIGWRQYYPVGGDSFYYHEGANLLADGKGFVHPYRLVFKAQDVPGADHPPGYMVVLALGSLLGLRSYLAHQLLSCVVGTATIVLLGYTTRRIINPRAGLLAAAIAAVYTNFWIYDGLVLSETLILFTVTLTILAAYRAWESMTPKWMVLLGVAVGISALTRSEAVLLAPLIMLPLLWWGRSRSRVNIVLLGGVGALSTLVVVAPWVAYNLSRFNRPVTLSGTPELALAISNCDDVYYGANVGYWSIRCANAPLRGAPDDDVTKAKLLREAGTDYISSHLGRVPIVMMARIGRTWGFYDPIGQTSLDENVDTREPFVGVSGAIEYYLLAIAAIGGILVLRQRGTPVFPLVAFALNVTIAVALAFGQTRYRATAEPALALLAAAAIDHAWTSLRPSQSLATSAATRSAASMNSSTMS